MTGIGRTIGRDIAPTERLGRESRILICKTGKPA